MLVNQILIRTNNQFDDSGNAAYSEAEKISWIDSAQKDIATKLPVDNLQLLIAENLQDTVQSTTGSYLYPLPIDFLKPIEVDYKNIPCVVKKVSQRQTINRNMDYYAIESEPLAIIREGKVEVFPSSGEVLINGLKIIYIKMPVTLTNLNDILILGNDYGDAIYNYAIGQGYARDGQPEADKYLSLYIGELTKAIGGIK